MAGPGSLKTRRATPAADQARQDATATTLIKRQWATNLSKFEGLQLPGGVQFNAQQMLSEANEEKSRLEEELSLKYELPPDFMTG